MEYAEIKDWLDKVVAVEKDKRDLLDFNGEIRLCNGAGEITVFRGIEIIADVMGLEISEEIIDKKCIVHPFFYRITYDGITFVQPCQERMERFAGADRKSDGC